MSWTRRNSAALVGRRRCVCWAGRACVGFLPRRPDTALTPSSHTWWLPQETAQLEADNFVLRQQTALSAEAKTVLDSWVRHEQAVRESEQSALVQTVQGNVLKALADAKVKKDLVAGAVADLERACPPRRLRRRRPFGGHAADLASPFAARRARQVQGHLSDLPLPRSALPDQPTHPRPVPAPPGRTPPPPLSPSPNLLLSNWT